MRTAIASLGRGSDCQTIAVASAGKLPPSIMAVRLRSKSVARSTCFSATAISLAACVAPSEYWKYCCGSIPCFLNQAVGMSQPDVEPTSAKEMRLHRQILRRLADSGDTKVSSPAP